MNGIKSSMPIHEVAIKLGIEVISETKARCFNVQQHKNGDANPSLSFIEGRSFKCFACGIHGNSYELIKQYMNINFKEAADWAQEKFGTNLKETQKNLDFEKNKNSNKLRIDILSKFIEICGAPSKEARNYFRSRKLSDGIIDWFRLTDVKDNTLDQLYKNFCKKDLESAGLLKNESFVFARHKLLIPYYHEDNTYYIKARTLENNNPKYTGLSGTITYPYNVDILLHSDISSDHIFITEGEIDCLTLLNNQINAIAVPGVNGFKEEWIRFFKKYEVIPVIAFDNDEYGMNGAKKLQSIFSKYGIGSKIKHPDKKDWNSEEWT